MARRSFLAMLALAFAGGLAFGAGQASASHVSCGDTITADTTLDSDLLNCPNNGILIGADARVFDATARLSGARYQRVVATAMRRASKRLGLEL